MIKKLVIKIFKLNDISDILIKARQFQKKLDDKIWTEKIKNILEKIKMEHKLEIQELESQMTLLKDQLLECKKFEKELNKKDFHVRIQAKDNALIATRIAQKVEDFGMNVMKIVGEMKGVREEAEEHKIKIEQKKYLENN